MTKVVKPDELVRPDESLKEEMRKLELSPQVKSTTHTVVDIVYLPSVVRISISSSCENNIVIDLVLCSWPYCHI